MMWPTAMFYLLVYVADGHNVTKVKFQTEGLASIASMVDAGLINIPTLTQMTVCLHFRLLHGGKGVPVVSYSNKQLYTDELFIGLNWYRHTLMIECCQEAVIEDLPLVVRLYVWQHLCVTLDLAADGVLIFAYNGKLNKKEKIIDQSKITPGRRVQVQGGGRLIIGQEQDGKEGKYDITQAMDGEIADYKFYNVLLTPEELLNFTTCAGPLPATTPPLLTLDDSRLEIKGPTAKTNISEEEICQNLTSYLLLIPEKVEFQESITTCNKLRGTLALPKNAVENINIIEQFQHFSSRCEDTYACLYWAGTKGILSTGHWVQLTNNEPVAWHNFHNPSQTPHEIYQCVAIASGNPSYRWLATPCVDYTTSCSLCNFTSHPLLRLRGLCQSSLFDRELYLNDYEKERPKFDGAKHSRVVWNSTSWVMISRLYLELRAVMHADTPDTYPIGLHNWTISGDKCGQGEVELMLTLCGNKEYTCDDGSCISKDHNCDTYTNCSDHSDELNCDIIIVPSGYSEELFPPSSTTDPLSIHFLINITSIRTFNLASFDVAIDAKWHTKWHDSRLTFTNLANNYQNNKVRHLEKLWTPELQVTDGTRSLVKGAQVPGDVYVIRRSEPLPDNDQRITEDYAYSGEDNTLMYQQHDTLEFRCHFDLHLYPFDTQKCYLEFSVRDLRHTQGVLLKDGLGVVFEGERSLLEYKLEKEVITSYTLNDVSVLQVSQ
ncbi:Neuronal pentraxin-2-like 2 [Homarus americanus]|uniref:Neuronal pentraxin-2-like 2 n=1 Tax=Homarus americanus TaxID=6706 RepID=A0A8J5MLT2_HOMAM|nr:Neuronal pentraxin-2-like 2 [Homarus americanus]